MRNMGTHRSVKETTQRGALRLSASALACALAWCLAGCAGFTPQHFDPVETLPETTRVAASYDEVFETIDAISQKQALQNRFSFNDDIATTMEESTAGEAGALSPKSTSTGSDYSETNVQVDGIDEGDILKTDGENIYMVCGSEIVISKAAGKATEILARISLDEKTVHKNTLGDYPVYPQELYIDGDVLAVVYQYSPNPDEGEDSSSSDGSYSYPYYKTITEVACFDIGDAGNPQYLTSFGQDGYCSSSRLQDGILYLISNHSVYDFTEIERDDPITYIPSYYTGSETAIAEPGEICILPDYDSVTYTIITSIDLAANARVDQQSILGASNTLYMGHDNLYLAESKHEEVVLGSYRDGSFQVTEYKDTYSTRIAKFAIKQGLIEFSTDATIPGTLLNQFSMDEYDGCLRVVTTVDSSKYRTIEDAKGTIDDYRSYETEPTTNALYILDSQLRTVGSIDGLAEEERVYAVRFDGPVGYFVTFRQVDPLFAVDLSDPANPVIKSELKIPGFSTYLHPFSENRLFGLGMAADENGRTQGLKMSMFDTSDAYDVTEKHVLHLGEDYSAALYDHKAILIDQEHDIIGFQTDGGYVVYGYSEEDGFYLRQKFDNRTDENDRYGYYAFNDRGLYVDSYFYLCRSDAIGIYDLETFNEVKQVAIPRSDLPDYGIQPLGSSSAPAGPRIGIAE